MSSERRWLIWNKERGQWWKQSRHGYTTLTHLAGRWTEDEVVRLLTDSHDDDMALEVPWDTWADEEFANTVMLTLVAAAKRLGENAEHKQ